MNINVGKKCHLCGNEIKSGDTVRVSQGSDAVYHEECWEKQMNSESKSKHASDHVECVESTDTEKLCCNNCGMELNADQSFCPKCGQKIVTEQKTSVCSNCGTALKDGQAFCPRCGQKIDAVVNSAVNDAINQFNSNIDSKKAKLKKREKTLIITGVAIAAIVLIINLMGGNNDFNYVYDEYCNSSWATLSSDAKVLEIDTNPYDIDDYSDSLARLALYDIHDELGLPSTLLTDMGETCALDGTQYRDYDDVDISVSWTYHPNRGLEIRYEIMN